MKSKEEIQRVHDMFAGVLLGEIELGLPPKILEAMTKTNHVLCWMLEHQHEKPLAFGELVRLVEDRFKERGYVLEDHNN